VFRLIYGGSAYSYANDPNFAEVSKSEKFWQGVIDEFYSKYKGLHKWHIKLMQEATTTKMVKLPTGRIYQFEPKFPYLSNYFQPVLLPSLGGQTQSQTSSESS